MRTRIAAAAALGALLILGAGCTAAPAPAAAPKQSATAKADTPRATSPTPTPPSTAPAYLSVPGKQTGELARLTVGADAVTDARFDLPPSANEIRQITVTFACVGDAPLGVELTDGSSKLLLRIDPGRCDGGPQANPVDLFGQRSPARIWILGSADSTSRAYAVVTPGG